MKNFAPVLAHPPAAAGRAPQTSQFPARLGNSKMTEASVTDTGYRLLTSKEAARLLGISEKTLRKDRSKHHLGIPFIRLGKAIRYDPYALLTWLQDRMVYHDNTPRRGRPPKAVVVAREREEQLKIKRALSNASKRNRLRTS